ncbi:MAG: hypothetical protein KAS40_23585 [Desulfobacterales bacterium]|nr:hypothetical protein [Desulfobacterales bacterium]
MNADAIEKIIKLAQPKEFPDKTSYYSISLKHVTSLSKTFGVSGREFEIIDLDTQRRFRHTFSVSSLYLILPPIHSRFCRTQRFQHI